MLDDPEFINLHNYSALKQQGKMSEEDVYMNFLEDYILGDDIDKTFFRDLCDNILKSYIKNNPSITYEGAYIRFLENICQRISGNSESYILLKSIRDCCRDKSDEFVNTGRKIEVIKANEGSVEKDENGKAVFKERKLTKPQVSNRLDRDCWLL